MRASLLAAASAVCALGAILCFIAGLVCLSLQNGYATPLFLCTFFMGPSARLFDWLATFFIYEDEEERKVMASQSDDEPARVVAERRFQALMEKRRKRAADRLVQPKSEKEEVSQV